MKTDDLDLKKIAEEASKLEARPAGWLPEPIADLVTANTKIFYLENLTKSMAKAFHDVADQRDAMAQLLLACLEDDSPDLGIRYELEERIKQTLRDAGVIP